VTMERAGSVIFERGLQARRVGIEQGRGGEVQGAAYLVVGVFLSAATAGRRV
jgi:hypothetical protein